MTTLQQKEILKSKILYLSKSRKWRYYIDTLILTGISIFIFSKLIIEFIIKSEKYNPAGFLFFSLFPILAILLFYHQKNGLKFVEINTSLLKQGNHKLVIETLEALHWKIKINNKGFVEAYSDCSWPWTWENQIISIIISDKIILFNSIYNVEDSAGQAITWGQNKRNIKKFLKTFFSLMENQKITE